MGIFDFFKKKPKQEAEDIEINMDFSDFSELTQKNIIWMDAPCLGRKPEHLIWTMRRSASYYGTRKLFRKMTQRIMDENQDQIEQVIIKALENHYPKSAIFAVFKEEIGTLYFGEDQEGKAIREKTHKAKLLIIAEKNAKGELGYTYYNSHPVSELVLPYDDPLRLQYPNLSRLMSIYYDEDFYDDEEENWTPPLSVMYDFCGEETKETIEGTLKEITAYLQTNPTPEEADIFLTSLGNEFDYLHSEITAIDWLERLKEGLERWVYHGDEPLYVEGDDDDIDDLFSEIGEVTIS